MPVRLGTYGTHPLRDDQWSGVVDLYAGWNDRGL